jgi:hypothetical protein
MGGGGSAPPEWQFPTTCSGGGYCDGTSADGTPVGTVICGGGMQKYECTTNGWSYMGQSCDPGMPYSCAPAPPAAVGQRCNPGCAAGAWCNSGDNMCYEGCVAKGVCTNGNAVPRKGTYYCDYSNCPPAPTPVDCVVSDWSPMSACSATACGTSGTQTQTRTVKTAAANGGKACPPLTNTAPCNAPACSPLDCVVSDWSPLSACDAVGCGTTGKQTQTRTVTTQPQYGGKACPSLTNSISCNAPPCPVDCAVSDWGQYGVCSATACGTTGTKTRTRTVTRQMANGGAACPSLTDSSPCSADPCPIDCAVSDWGQYGACSATACGTTGTKTRSRTVTAQAANGGVHRLVLQLQLQLPYQHRQRLLHFRRHPQHHHHRYLLLPHLRRFWRQHLQCLLHLLRQWFHLHLQR